MKYMRSKKTVKIVKDEFFEGGLPTNHDCDIKFGVNSQSGKGNKRNKNKK